MPLSFNKDSDEVISIYDSEDGFIGKLEWEDGGYLFTTDIGIFSIHELAEIVKYASKDHDN